MFSSLPFLASFLKKKPFTKIPDEIANKFLQVYTPGTEVQIKMQTEKNEEVLSQREWEKKMEITYLPHLVFLNRNILSEVFTSCKNGSVNPENKWLGIYYQDEVVHNKHPKLVIRYINRVKEYGLFADEDIQSGRFILEYTGLVKPYHWKNDSHNPYCFEYPLHKLCRTPFTIDARDMGNESRFINHSTHPNLMPSCAYIEGVLHLVLLSRTTIKKGTELTYDYGPKYWEKREKPNEEIL